MPASVKFLTGFVMHVGQRLAGGARYSWQRALRAYAFAERWQDLRPRSEQVSQCRHQAAFLASVMTMTVPKQTLDWYHAAGFICVQAGLFIGRCSQSQ